MHWKSIFFRFSRMRARKIRLSSLNFIGAITAMWSHDEVLTKNIVARRQALFSLWSSVAKHYRDTLLRSNLLKNSECILCECIFDMAVLVCAHRWICQIIESMNIEWLRRISKQLLWTFNEFLIFQNQINFFFLCVWRWHQVADSQPKALVEHSLCLKAFNWFANM